MAKFVRKVDKRTWLTDARLKDRVERGVNQFRDPEDKPSVYKGDTREEITLAIAALAWDRKGRIVERIERTDYVIITDDCIREAGLSLVQTPSVIPWPALEDRHFQLTRAGAPCTDEDLRRLVETLIARGAEHDRIPRDELRRIASSHCGGEDSSWGRPPEGR